jgi:hypothetical protein
MKLIDAQRSRIDAAMANAQGKRYSDMLAAGLRELAKLDYFKYDSWPNDIASSCVLDNVADCLEAK